MDKKMYEVLTGPIDALNMPKRASHPLMSARLNVVWKLALMSDEVLLQKRGFGNGGLEDLKAALKKGDLGHAIEDLRNYVREVSAQSFQDIPEIRDSAELKKFLVLLTEQQKEKFLSVTLECIPQLTNEHFFLGSMKDRVREFYKCVESSTGIDFAKIKKQKYSNLYHDHDFDPLLKVAQRYVFEKVQEDLQKMYLE